MKYLHTGDMDSIDITVDLIFFSGTISLQFKISLNDIIKVKQMKSSKLSCADLPGWGPEMGRGEHPFIYGRRVSCHVVTDCHVSELITNQYCLKFDAETHSLLLTAPCRPCWTLMRWVLLISDTGSKLRLNFADPRSENWLFQARVEVQRKRD